MTLAQQAIIGINSAHEFFNRSTRNLTEAEATLRPAPGMMTAAQQVAHAAQTIDWFMEGAFRPEGFDLDFDAHARAVEGVTTLAEARAWFERSVDAAKATMGAMTDAELLEPIAAGPVMGGAPRMAVVSAITDHTAHHRGALTVYARLAGIVPPMPYGDM
jgi:uncharacterized damage-inducible protein DinB